MFAVKICICTDGDFGYEEPEFDANDEEKIFYFENRHYAVKALIRSFHNLKNSLRPCGREHIKRWIDSMDNRIELIAKKICAFNIHKDFGNQWITYELFEVEKRYLDNGSFYYDIISPPIDFSWYEVEMIRWDEFANLPDVE